MVEVISSSLDKAIEWVQSQGYEVYKIVKINKHTTHIYYKIPDHA